MQAETRLHEFCCIQSVIPPVGVTAYDSPQDTIFSASLTACVQSLTAKKTPSYYVILLKSLWRQLLSTIPDVNFLGKYMSGTCFFNLNLISQVVLQCASTSQPPPRCSGSQLYDR